MKTLKKYLLESLFGIIGVALLGIWALYHDHLVKYLAENSNTTIPALGWSIIILVCIVLLLLSLCLHQFYKNKNHFKNCIIDQNTGAVIIPKDEKHYCPSCWGKNLKYPVLYEFDAWICTNRACPNSEHPMKRNMPTNKSL